MLSYTTLQYYGPGACASSEVSLGTAQGDIKGRARPQATVPSQGLVVNADATRLVNSPATLTGLGQVTTALPKGRARPTATISIGARPSAEDIVYNLLDTSTGAVDGLTIREVLKAILAVQVGKTAIADNGDGTAVVRFKAQDGTTDRVTADMAGSTRETVTLNL